MTLKEIFMYALAAIVVITIVGFTAVLYFVPMPPDNKDLINIALGSFLAAFGTVVGYFFGSSKSSADKNELLKSKEPDGNATNQL